MLLQDRLDEKKLCVNVFVWVVELHNVQPLNTAWSLVGNEGSMLRPKAPTSASANPLQLHLCYTCTPTPVAFFHPHVEDLHGVVWTTTFHWIPQ